MNKLHKTWTILDPFSSEIENKSLGVYLRTLISNDLVYTKISHDFLQVSDKISSEVVLLEVR